MIQSESFLLKTLLQFFKRIFKKIWTSNAMLYIHIHSYPASVLFNMIQTKSIYLPLVCHFFGCNIFIFNNIKAIYFCLYIFLIYCFIIEANQRLLFWIAIFLVEFLKLNYSLGALRVRLYKNGVSLKSIATWFNDERTCLQAKLKLKFIHFHPARSGHPH